jgi:quinol monooxygenase YgiN
MFAIFVTVNVKPGMRDAFVKAVLGDAQGSVRDEPGCFRFDVLLDEADPNRLYFYEVYRDQAALEKHRTMPHYTKWRETVKDWFDGPTSRVAAKTAFPSDAGWEKQKPSLTLW